MKTIEECLDIILRELVKNWDKPNNDRDELKGEKLLEMFGLPDQMRKHEFYKRLIRKLVRDEYAETTDEKIVLTQNTDISVYDKETIITIEGFYLITQKGGYEETKRIADLKDELLSEANKATISATKIARYGAIGSVLFAALAFIVAGLQYIKEDAVTQQDISDMKQHTSQIATALQKPDTVVLKNQIVPKEELPSSTVDSGGKK